MNEFSRLPFGLKNTGRIFQRAIGDILREHIGRCFYLYVEDVIVWSESENDHVKQVDAVLGNLLDANMRVALEKTQFFKKKCRVSWI